MRGGQTERHTVHHTANTKHPYTCTSRGEGTQTTPRSRPPRNASAHISLGVLRHSLRHGTLHCMQPPAGGGMAVTLIGGGGNRLGKFHTLSPLTITLGPGSDAETDRCMGPRRDKWACPAVLLYPVEMEMEMSLLYNDPSHHRECTPAPEPGGGVDMSVLPLFPCR